MKSAGGEVISGGAFPSLQPLIPLLGGALVLVEAITFECQKIILPVIFSHVRDSAKAKNGRGGGGG